MLRDSDGLLRTLSVPLARIVAEGGGMSASLAVVERLPDAVALSEWVVVAVGGGVIVHIALSVLLSDAEALRLGLALSVAGRVRVAEAECEYDVVLLFSVGSPEVSSSSALMLSPLGQ